MTEPRTCWLCGAEGGPGGVALVFHRQRYRCRNREVCNVRQRNRGWSPSDGERRVRDRQAATAEVNE